MSRLLHVKEREIKALRIRLVKVTTANGITVSEGIHQDLLQIMNLHNNQHSSESNSFASIFWNQQFNAATLKDRRQMRWHPAMIQWCLYLHHHSSGAYSTLHSSGVITLPTERTLSDYRHHSPAKCGFSAATYIQLLEVLKQQKPAHLAKYVVVVLD